MLNLCCAIRSKKLCITLIYRFISRIIVYMCTFKKKKITKKLEEKEKKRRKKLAHIECNLTHSCMQPKMMTWMCTGCWQWWWCWWWWWWWWCSNNQQKPAKRNYFVIAKIKTGIGKMFMANRFYGISLPVRHFGILYGPTDRPTDGRTDYRQRLPECASKRSHREIVY